MCKFVHVQLKNYCTDGFEIYKGASQLLQGRTDSNLGMTGSISYVLEQSALGVHGPNMIMGILIGVTH